MSNFRVRECLAIGSLWFNALLIADEALALDEAEFLFEIPTVTSATRIPQEINHSPVAVTYIDRAMIQASGATEIPQLLKLVPGFLSYYALGNQFGVTNRGITSDFAGDLEITVDGRSVYETLFSAVFWTSIGITVEDIEYIEVVRGTNAAAYGSNAFLGAINIVTNRPARQRGASFNLLLGDIDTAHGQFDFSGTLGSMDYTLGIVHRQNDGFPFFSAEPPVNRATDSNEGTSLRFEGLFTPNINDTIRVHLGIGEDTLDVPAKGIFGANRGFRTRDLKSNFQMVRWERQLNNGNQFRAQVYHNRLAIDEPIELGLVSAAFGVDPSVIPLVFDGQPDEFVISGIQDSFSERYDLELSYNFMLSGGNRAVLGVDARLDRAKSQWLLNRPDAKDSWSYRQFGNVEYGLHPGIVANVGWMIEYDDIVGSTLSPRAALNLQVLDSSNLRLSISRGNRVPSVVEAFEDVRIRFANGSLIQQDVISDADIAESKVTEYELGLVSLFSENKVTLEARLVRTEVRDALDIAPFIEPTFFEQLAVRQGNYTDWNANALDLSLKYNFNAHSFISAQFSMTDWDGFNRARAEVFAADPTKRPPDIIVGRPAKRAGSILAATRWGDFDLSAAFYYESESDWEAGDPVGGHNRTDIRIAREFLINDGSLRVELIGQSILDTYVEYILFNRFEPRYFLRLNYSHN